LDPREAAAGLWKAMVAGMIIAPGENYFVVQDDKDEKEEADGTTTPDNASNPDVNPDILQTPTAAAAAEVKAISRTYHPHISTRDALKSIRALPITTAPQTKVLTTRSRSDPRSPTTNLDTMIGDDTGTHYSLSIVALVVQSLSLSCESKQNILKQCEPKCL
jgi:hypothetical protein